MNLAEALEIINEVRNKSYWWMAVRGPGLDRIKKAVAVIERCKSSTELEKKYAHDIKWKIRRK